MIYFSADDYGLNDISSLHIEQLTKKKALNKVSVFPNIEQVYLNKIADNARLCLHLNLVEGKCMANADETDLIAYPDGSFRHTFEGLFKLSLLQPKKLEAQVYKEIKAQILFWKNILPENAPFCIDSHQHTHMIPVIFTALIKVLKDENIPLDYMRIPCEPVLPYIKAPSLYFTYSGINIIKQWLINFLWLINKKHTKSFKIPTAYFMGILFSGNMDEKRITKILPEYIKIAEKKGRDIEVLFHPGYLDKKQTDFKNKNIVFESFYLSEKRKTEFDSVINISERSVI